jgi:hypothetical protein
MRCPPLWSKEMVDGITMALAAAPARAKRPSVVSMVEVVTSFEG